MVSRWPGLARIPCPCAELSRPSAGAALLCFWGPQAFARSLRNLHYFERYRGRTVAMEQVAKYGKTKVRGRAK